MYVWRGIDIQGLWDLSVRTSVHSDRLEMQFVKLEEGVVMTVCKMKLLFPPSFFTVMVHLTVHLSYETRIAGSGVRKILAYGHNVSVIWVKILCAPLQTQLLNKGLDGSKGLISDWKLLTKLCKIFPQAFSMIRSFVASSTDNSTLVRKGDGELNIISLSWFVLSFHFYFYFSLQVLLLESVCLSFNYLICCSSSYWWWCAWIQLKPPLGMQLRHASPSFTCIQIQPIFGLKLDQLLLTHPQTWIKASKLVYGG